MHLAVCIALMLIVGFLINYLYRKPFVDNLKSKCILITGTDSGFGKKLALELDKKGIQVYAGCYTQDGAETLRKEASQRMKIVENFDVTKEESLIATRNFIEKDLTADQELWGLVNNAGICQGIIFHVSTLDDYKAVMEVNFFGVIRSTETFLPLIKKSNGRLVNVISVIGRATAFADPYATSKFAMEAYNDGLRRYMMDYGVSVAAIEPGNFPTQIIHHTTISKDLDRSWEKLPEHLKMEYGDDFFRAVKEDVTGYAKKTAKTLGYFNSLEMVTDAITHALYAKHPRARYYCGLDARFLLRYAPYLPDWVADAAVRFYFSLYKTLGRHLKERRNEKTE